MLVGGAPLQQILAPLHCLRADRHVVKLHDSRVTLTVQVVGGNAPTRPWVEVAGLVASLQQRSLSLDTERHWGHRAPETNSPPDTSHTHTHTHAVFTNSPPLVSRRCTVSKGASRPIHRALPGRILHLTPYRTYISLQLSRKGQNRATADPAHTCRCTLA